MTVNFWPGGGGMVIVHLAPSDVHESRNVDTTNCLVVWAIEEYRFHR
jgi:hypothetical protein